MRRVVGGWSWAKAGCALAAVLAFSGAADYGVEANAPLSVQKWPAPILGLDVPVRIEVVDKKTWWEQHFLSTMALTVSVLSAFASISYTHWSSSRARRRSVNDDFWLRTVTYPLLVEPTVEFFSRLMRSLPKAGNTDVEALSTVQAFRATVESDLEQHYTSLLVIATVMKHGDASSTYQGMQEALEEVEDAVTAYCHALSVWAENPEEHEPPSREDATSALQNALQRFLEPIRDWQSKA